MDVDDLWKRVLGEVELEVTRAVYLTYFRNTRASLSENDNTVTVLCPNPASFQTLQTRYIGLIKSRLEARLKLPVRIRFQVAAAQIKQQASPGPLFQQQNITEGVIRTSGLNPHYSFDNFAVSESNQMAFAAARAVASNLATAYNPLFFWGSVGVGKTHLAQSLGRFALEKKPETKLIYCTGEEFTNEIIDAIRRRTAASFKRKYRTANLFIVDDIQFIAGKESVQMEFFHTFNSIVQAGGQVVLTSDLPPGDIKKLEARLSSRFEGGLIVDIGRPNFELLTAILHIKARERGTDLSPDVAQQLAANFENARSLEGSLLRFLSEAEREPDHQKILKRIIRTPQTQEGEAKTKKNPSEVVEIVSSYYGLRVALLKSSGRKRSIAEPRQVAMYLLRHDLGLSQSNIGEILGGRDHTTVIHGVEKITRLLPKNEKLRGDLVSLRRLISG